MNKGNILIRIALFFLLILFANSCSTQPPKHKTPEDQIDKALQTSISNNQILDQKHSGTLPDSLEQELVPDFSYGLPPESKKTEQHFDVAVKDVLAQDFFMGLVKDTKQSMIVSPDVAGTISLNLKDVTVPEVMAAVRDIYGYEYKRTSFGYEVFPRKLSTRIFTVNYIDIDRKGKSYTAVSSGDINQQVTNTSNTTGNVTGTTSTSALNLKPSSSIDTDSDANFWKSLRTTLVSIVGKEDGASVVVNPQAGLVIVHAYPEGIRNAAHYLDSMQNIVKRQVLIEAKILEVALSADFQSGVNWNVFGVQQEGNKNFNDNIKHSDADFSNIFSINIKDDGNFNATIKLLSTQGKVNVLSSPRISTINNQKAVIKVGQNNFFVTNVQSDVSAITTTNNNNVIAQNIDFTPFFSGIALDVTPQIDEHNNVILHIHPIISKVSQEDKKFVVNGQNQEIPLAQSEVRESDSIVEAQSGQVVVIGGLMETRSADYQAGTPGAADLPSVGGLFKDTNKEAEKFELVILLRPIVVENGSWTKQLQKVAQENKETQGEFGYTTKFDKK